MRKNPRFILLGIGLSAILAACSSSGASPSAAAPSVAAPSAAASEAPTGATTVAVGESALGQILVDGAGRTLYAFTKDTAGESTCYDDCATNWPALTVDGSVTVGAGLDASMFSTVARTDGATQAKVGDWPLYYFAADTGAGDTNGQKVGDVWFVVSPTGELIKG